MAMTPAYMRQSNLIIGLIVFVGLVSGYVYYSQIAVESDLGITPLRDDSRDNLSKFKDINLDFSVLNSPAIDKLQPFGEVPVVPATDGKNNPFASF